MRPRFIDSSRKSGGDTRPSSPLRRKQRVHGCVDQICKGGVTKVDYMILEDRAAEITTLLKSIANRHRLQIIRLLAEKEHSVGELEKIVGLSQSALSQHLARLRRDKMVMTRRNAQTIYYSLAGSLPRSLVATRANVFAQYSTAASNDSSPMASAS